MSRPRYLCDNDVNENILSGIERLEPTLEFFRVRERGWARLPDATLLEHAAAEGLIVVSHDTNTMSAAAKRRLLANLPMPGLFLIDQSLPIGIAIDQLITIWAASEAEEWTSLIIKLPIKS